MLRPKALSRTNLSSSTAGPRRLDAFLPDLILRIGMRSIDHQISCGNLEEAKALSETLDGLMPFERAA